MQINVRHEAATAADEPPGSPATPEQTCVWIVGDDSGTQATEYLKPGEVVGISIDHEPGFMAAKMGIVAQGFVPPPEKPPAAE